MAFKMSPLSQPQGRGWGSVGSPLSPTLQATGAFSSFLAPPSFFFPFLFSYKWQPQSQAESESLLLAALQHSWRSESGSGMSEGSGREGWEKPARG